MLLDDQLRNRLPALYSQEAEPDPIVYAKFFLPGTGWTWYVTEGGEQGNDFLFFGFVSDSGEFTRFRLSELQAVRDLTGAQVELDLTFTEGRLTDVVPAPDY